MTGNCHYELIELKIFELNQIFFFFLISLTTSQLSRIIIFIFSHSILLLYAHFYWCDIQKIKLFANSYKKIELHMTIYSIYLYLYDTSHWNLICKLIIDWKLCQEINQLPCFVNNLFIYQFFYMIFIFNSQPILYFYTLACTYYILPQIAI